MNLNGKNTAKCLMLSSFILLLLPQAFAMIASIDVTLHVDGVESTVFYWGEYFQIESRVWAYAHQGPQVLLGTAYLIRDNPATRDPKTFRREVRLATDVNRCYSKLFFANRPTRGFCISLNEVHQHRIEIPASLLLLDNLGLFVEVNLYREETRQEDGSKFMFYLGSKVLKISNVLQGVHENTNVVIDKGYYFESRIPMTVHASLHSVKILSDTFTPTITEAGPEYKVWLEMMDSCKNKNQVVREWYYGESRELDRFIKDGENFSDNILDAQLNFILNATQLAGKHFNEEEDKNAPTTFVRGLDTLQTRCQGTSCASTCPAKFHEACDGCRQLLIESFYYIYAKLLAQNLLRTLDMTMDFGQENYDAYLNALLQGDSDAKQTPVNHLQFVRRNPQDEASSHGVLFRKPAAGACTCKKPLDLHLHLNAKMDALGILGPAASDKGANSKFVYVTLDGFPSVWLQLGRVDFNKLDVQASFKAIHTHLEWFTRILQDHWDKYVRQALDTGVPRYDRKYWDNFKHMVWKWSTAPAEKLPELQRELFALPLTDEHHHFLLATYPLATFTGKSYRNTVRTESPEEHLVVFAHGLGTDGEGVYDRLQTSITLVNTPFKCLFARSYTDYQHKSLQEMGWRLADEIKEYLIKKASPKLKYISFYGHSLGGLAIRAALPHLKEYASKFYAFITYATSHIGFAHFHGDRHYCHLHYLCFSVWVMSHIKVKTSIRELAMRDAWTTEGSLIYKMSLDDSLKHFKVVRFFASKPDKYCYRCSALVDTSCVSRCKKAVHQMAHNIMKHLNHDGVSKVRIDYHRAGPYIGHDLWDEGHSATLRRSVVSRIFAALVGDIF